jgi:hypothetical protein
VRELHVVPVIMSLMCDGTTPHHPRLIIDFSQYLFRSRPQFGLQPRSHAEPSDVHRAFVVTWGPDSPVATTLTSGLPLEGDR